MSEQHEAPYMRAAIEASRQALAAGDMPFGASLVKDGQLLWVALNKQRTGADCTAHAELVLVREARQALGEHSTVGATVYASGEPCAMCAGAMFWAGIGRMVYALSGRGLIALAGSGEEGRELDLPSREVFAGGSQPTAVSGPHLEDEAAEPHRGFWR